MTSSPVAVRGLLAALAVVVAAPAFAQPPDPPAPPPNGQVPAVETKSLGECLAIALANRPTIKAAQATLNAGGLGYRALANLSPVAQLVSPDLPIRRQQAMRGLTLSQAEVEKARNDTTYDVTRLYYTYVYATLQEKTAADVIVAMEIYLKSAEEILKEGIGGKKINQFTIYGLRNLIGEVKQLRIKADAGRKLALEALYEAMAVDSRCANFVPRDTVLPLMGGTVTKELVVSEALCRRPELAMAAAGVDVFRLEVAAQDKNRRGVKVPTFASGTDLHSKLIPDADRGTEYRPGAIAPEMPTLLVGSRKDRVARAAELSYRQDVLYEGAVNLIRLEAGNAFLQWEAATQQMEEARKKYETGQKMADDARAAAVAKQDPEFLVNNEAIAGKARAAYVEAVFDHLRALAALERVTAGAIRPDFPGR